MNHIRGPVGFRNAITVDVEDYFQVSAFDSPGRRKIWGSFESRVCGNTARLLDLFAETSTHATFFVLGWVAERYPALVRQIARSGHEIASHGYEHRLVYNMSPKEFRADIARAKRAIEDASGGAVRGFRAPSFSVTRQSLWALDVLIDEGYTYDSSVFPIRRDRYGLPGAPRQVHLISRARGSIVEVPPSTVRLAGLTIPVAGGGYFRLYPYDLTRRAIRRLNECEGVPAVVYLHPWELDPGQPRQSGSWLNRFRHYVNLEKTEARFRRLLREFRFASVTAAAIAPADFAIPSVDNRRRSEAAGVPAFAVARYATGSQ